MIWINIKTNGWKTSTDWLGQNYLKKLVSIISYNKYIK